MHRPVHSPAQPCIAVRSLKHSQSDYGPTRPQQAHLEPNLARPETIPGPAYTIHPLFDREGYACRTSWLETMHCIAMQSGYVEHSLRAPNTTTCAFSNSLKTVKISDLCQPNKRRSFPPQSTSQIECPPDNGLVVSRQEEDLS